MMAERFYREKINEPTTQQIQSEIKLQSDIPHLLEEHLLILKELLQGLAQLYRALILLQKKGICKQGMEVLAKVIFNKQ